MSIEDGLNIFGVPYADFGGGTANDTKGYFGVLNGQPRYLNYEKDLSAYGSPLSSMRMSGGGGEAGSDPIATGEYDLNPNAVMLQYAPRYDPKESFFAPFMGAIKDLGPFAALTGVGAGLQSLAAGGSFMGGGGGILGDMFRGFSGGFDPGMAFGGESAIQGSSYAAPGLQEAPWGAMESLGLPPGQGFGSVADAPFDVGAGMGLTTDGQFNLDNAPMGSEAAFGGSGGMGFGGESAMQGAGTYGVNPMTGIRNVGGKLLEYLQTPKGMLQGGSLLANLFQASKTDKFAKQMLDQYMQAQRASQANQFPFQNYHGEYQNFMNNPLAYMQQKSPGFLASQNYVSEAQKRQNAGSGFNKAGYGDALMATVLGQNADSWYKSTGNQLGQAAGVGFSPASSFAATAGGLPQMFNQQNRSRSLYGDLFKGAVDMFGNAGILKP